MIVLHQFPSEPDGINLSPFCLKLEAWLKLAGLPYRIEPIQNLEGAPKRKAPWIRDSDGTVMGDSRLIAERLTRTRGVDPDAHLTPRQRALGLAVTALVEERLYFAMVWWRWIHEGNFRILRDHYFGDIPEPAREEVANHWRSVMAGCVEGQGIGRHTEDEITAIGNADVDALAALVEGPWLFGDRPCGTDCTVWAMLANLLHPTFDTPMARRVRRQPVLLALYAAGRAAWFPDAPPADAG